MRGAVAKKLAQSFFVVRNAMLFHQRNEVRRRVSCERRFGKVRIGRDKVFRLAVQVGKVAASAAGNQDLLANASGTLQHGNAPAALAGLNGAHESRRATAE